MGGDLGSTRVNRLLLSVPSVTIPTTMRDDGIHGQRKPQ